MACNNKMSQNDLLEWIYDFYIQSTFYVIICNILFQSPIRTELVFRSNGCEVIVTMDVRDIYCQFAQDMRILWKLQRWVCLRHLRLRSITAAHASCVTWCLIIQHSID